MRVAGIDVDDAVIAAAIARQNLAGGFTCSELELALTEAGLPKGEIAMRTADRALQRAKRNKTLILKDRKWYGTEAA